MIRRFILLTTFCVSSAPMLLGQVGIGTTSPHNSAVLDVSGTNKGFLIPRVVDTSAVTSPATGLQIYDTGDDVIYFYDGTRWVSSAIDNDWFEADGKLMRIVGTDTFVVINNANGNVGIGTTSPHSSALLDLSATDKGLLVPRVALTSTTDVTTISSPETSLLVYNTATAEDITPGYYYFDGNKWLSFSVSSTLPIDTICSTIFFRDTTTVCDGGSGTCETDPNNITTTIGTFLPDTLNDNSTREDTCMLYIGQDGSTWRYNGTNYVTVEMNVDPWWNSATKKPSNGLTDQLFHYGSVNIGTGESDDAYLNNLTVGFLHDSIAGRGNVVGGWENKHIYSNYNAVFGLYHDSVYYGNLVSGIDNDFITGAYNVVGGRGNKNTYSHYNAVFGLNHDSIYYGNLVSGRDHDFITGAYNIVSGNDNNNVYGTNIAVFGAKHDSVYSYNLVSGYNNDKIKGQSNIITGSNHKNVYDNYNAVFGVFHDSIYRYNLVSGYNNDKIKGQSNIITGSNHKNVYDNYNAVFGVFHDSIYRYNLVSGYKNDKITGQANIVSGYTNNNTYGNYNAVFGVYHDSINSGNLVSGNNNNHITGNNNAVFGRANDNVSGHYGIVSGYDNNNVYGNSSAVFGFKHDSVYNYNLVSGYNNDLITGQSNIITGSNHKNVYNNYNAVFGIYHDSINYGNLVSGRDNDFITGAYNVVSGYDNNNVYGHYSAVFGHKQDSVNSYNLVSGYNNDLITGQSNIVVGSNHKSVYNNYNAVFGIYHDSINYANMVSGYDNDNITGSYNTVMGYSHKNIRGNYNFVAGNNIHDLNGNSNFMFSASPMSSTASNQVNFLNRLVMDSVGNVGIGTTTPKEKLHIRNGNSITENSLPGTTFNRIWSSSDGFSQGTALQLGTKVDGVGKPDYSYYLGTDELNTNTAPNLKIGRGDNTEWGLPGDNDFMTFEYATGNVGIGTTSPTSKLEVEGGTTPAGLMRSSAVSVLRLSSQSTDASGVLRIDLDTAPTSTNWSHHEMISFYGGSPKTNIGSIAPNAAGTSTQYLTTSDQRLKHNIKATKYTLADLMSINVKDYTYKADTTNNVETGMLAQELYKIFPDAVSVGTDEVDENGNLVKPWTVDYGRLTPLLIKAIQELKAQNDVLKAEVVNKDEQLKASIKDTQQRLATLEALLQGTASK